MGCTDPLPNPPLRWGGQHTHASVLPRVGSKATSATLHANVRLHILMTRYLPT